MFYLTRVFCVFDMQTQLRVKVGEQAAPHQNTNQAGNKNCNDIAHQQTGKASMDVNRLLAQGFLQVLKVFAGWWSVEKCEWRSYLAG